MKALRNLFILLRYWDVVSACFRLMDDPKSKFATKSTEKLTVEEMDGVVDMDRMYRVLTMNAKELKKDLSHLRKRLAE